MFGISLSELMVILSIAMVISCIDNGLGKTPPLGWNSWNKYGCIINQTIVAKQAALLVSTTLASKGYQYLVIDDCWQANRNPITRQINEDRTTFPSGLASLIDLLHVNKLKVGLMTDVGNETKSKRIGSFGNEKVDANTFAGWKLDYLKIDNCNQVDFNSKIRFSAFSQLINETGRAIYIAVNNNGKDQVEQWATFTANSWRTAPELITTLNAWTDFIEVLNHQNGLQKYASNKYGWNDPGVLQTGLGTLTSNQEAAQFVLWSVLKAPLFIGCDIASLSSSTLNLLLNQQLIAINQDSLGLPASRIRYEQFQKGAQEIWGGSLSSNRYVIVFLNELPTDSEMKISLKQEVKLTIKSSYLIRDPLRKNSLGSSTNDEISAKVSTHSVEIRVLQFFDQKKVMRDPLQYSSEDDRKVI